jgi:hypothetical protein
VHLRVGDDLRAAAVSGPPVSRLEEVQHRLGDGPACTAAVRGQEVEWKAAGGAPSELADAAIGTGLVAALSVPLVGHAGVGGAVTIWTRGDPVCAPSEVGAVRTLAAHAAWAIDGATSLVAARLTAQHLRLALEDRDLIGQAKGVLMMRKGTSAARAFDVLRRASQTSGRSLAEVAAEVVRAG